MGENVIKCYFEPAFALKTADMVHVWATNVDSKKGLRKNYSIIQDFFFECLTKHYTKIKDIKRYPFNSDFYLFSPRAERLHYTAWSKAREIRNHCQICVYDFLRKTTRMNVVY